MSELKRTQLYDVHVSAGATMVDFGGWEMPIQYPSGIIAEHLYTRQVCGLFDVSHMGRLLIEGPQRKEFLQHVLTSNVSALDLNMAQYCIIPNENGGAVDDAYLYLFQEDSYLLVVNAANIDKDLEHLNRALSGFDCTITNISAEWASIAVQGPKSKEMLMTLSGGELFCQAEFADALIDACREEKIPVAVETNLNWQIESARPILEQLDLIMFDVKIFDSVEHKRWTGVENAELLDNARRLDTLDRPLIARTPLIPGATDSAENIRAIAGFLRNFRNLRCYELLNFNPLGESKYRALEEKTPFVSARPLKPEALNRLREAAESVGKLTIQIW